MSQKFTLFFISYLLLQTCFLFLVPITPVYELLSLIIIILIVLFSLKKIKAKRYVFSKYMLFFMFFIFIEVIFSYIKYRQGLVYTLYVAEYNFFILAYYIVSNYLQNGLDVKKVYRIFIWFSFMLSLLYIVQFIVYKSGLIFLHVPISTRFGSVRINYITIIPNLGFLLSLVNFLDNKNNKSFKKLCLINIVITFIYIIFVSKVRVAIAIIIACALVTMLAKYRKKFIALMYFIVLITSLSFTFVYYTEPKIVTQYINSVDSNDDSYIIRQSAIEYFLMQAKANPIFGVGFIFPREGTEPYFILRGPYGKFYTNDVGIIGMFQTFGFTGVVWYTLLLFKMLRMLFSIIKRKHTDNSIEFITLYMYILLTSFTLIITDNFRNFMLPVILGIMEYYYIQSLKHNNDTNKYIRIDNEQ